MGYKYYAVFDGLFSNWGFMPDVLTYYLKRIEKLRTALIDGKPAPHKPILLKFFWLKIRIGSMANGEKKP